MSKKLPLKEGPFLESSSWPPVEKGDPPRALKTLAAIIDGGLCHRCGTCIGICPTQVFGRDGEEYPLVENLSACTDCDLCVKVCPGDEFDAEGVAERMFPEAPPCGDMHGHFESAYLSFACDKKLRANSTSGGLITALLIHLLESGEIDGAIVVCSDSEDRWKGKPTIARTKEELLESTKSKYAIAPTNIAFEEVRSVNGKYALVGLPCQIHGFHKAAELDPRIKERVVLTIGLFCHAAVEHEPMREIWNRSVREVGGEENISRFISRVGKHPGTPHVELKDGSLKPVYFPKAGGYRPSSMEIINILYRLYTPPRCLTCYDSTSEFADIAVGDPWMAPPSDEIDFKQGYSFALARTAAGEKFIQKAKAENAISLLKLNKETARKSNTMMGEEKRWRAFRVIETHRRQGKAVPHYGFSIPRPSGFQFIKTEANMLSHVFCFLPSVRIFVLRLAFSPLGYCLLWLNNKRRSLRVFLRDTAALIRRKVTGTTGVDGC